MDPSNYMNTYACDFETYYLKVLRQVGTGKPIMKPLAGAETAEKSIDFRSIKQRDTSPQIKVNAAAGDDNIIVEGNNVGGDNAAVTVVDGLVTVVKALAIDDGQDLDLVTWEFVMNVADGYLAFYSSAQTTVDCWRLGIYVGSFAYGDPYVPAASGGGVVLTTRDVSFVTVAT